MNTISNESSKTAVTTADWAGQVVKDTILPLGIKIASGSLLTWSSPQDIAAAFIAQKCFQTVGEAGLVPLSRTFQLAPGYTLGLAIANFSLSFFAAVAATRHIGFQPSYLAMGAGVIVNFGIGLYQFAQYLKEDCFKESEKIVTVTAQNFQEEVENSKLPVILDVYATWCPPCRMVAPIFEKLAEEMEGKVKFVKMNIDNEPELATKLNVNAMPTFLFFKDGKEVHRRQGAVQREYFVDQIKVLQE